MPISQRATVVAAVVAALATAHASLLGIPSPALAQEPDPYAGAPAVGACKSYGRDAGSLTSESSPVVECSQPHTAKVIAVALLPDHLGWESSPLDIGRFALKTCIPAWVAILGRTDKVRWMSAYAFFWFYPTIPEREAGARWVRCDVILTGGASKIMPLPKDSSPMLPKAPLPNSVAACLSGLELDRTVCSRAHRFRATGAKTLDRTYPGATKRTQLAKQLCPSRTTSKTWRAVWPSRQAWRLDQHTLVCYSKTRN